MSNVARSESGLPLAPVYGPGALDGFNPEATLGAPGEFPFTRGVYPSMYTGRPWIEADQCERLAVLRAERDNHAVTRALSDLRRTAASTGNVLPPLREALRLRATGGEVANALRDIWGVYQPNDAF